MIIQLIYMHLLIYNILLYLYLLKCGLILGWNHELYNMVENGKHYEVKNMLLFLLSDLNM